MRSRPTSRQERPSSLLQVAKTSYVAFSSSYLSVGLPVETSRDLELTRVCNHRGNRSRRSRTNARSRYIEVSVIQQVESLDAELHAHPFRHPEVFAQAEVDRLQARCDEDVASSVPERILSRAHEAGCVVPLLDGPL